MQALVVAGRWLREHDYHFTAVTPATHGRVNARPGAQLAARLRDVFGWSRSFEPSLLPDPLTATLQAVGLLAPLEGGLLRSEIRFSSLEGMLFAHSAYPTTAEDAVFFGPDTHRFATLIAQELARKPLAPGARILDVGCGAGAGGLLASRHARPPTSTVLADINTRALSFARANAELAGASGVSFVQSDLFASTAGTFDLIAANPPYLNDRAGRTYRHGGGRWGEALSVRIVHEGLGRLAPGGRLVLYTGVPMSAGADPLWAALHDELTACGWPCRYREIDPDVFGEELAEPAYANVERIAAMALVVERPLP
ncbi:methyltransferase [Ramlibacter sp. AW1]|uniref:Methyltransferase n=1 Tax=Ramlibacter aurantiacus TaxID=2801330 RepID=A0A937D596_9BURK|nr:methyltransferase [Ramlibacter aurantiacus]